MLHLLAPQKHTLHRLVGLSDVKEFNRWRAFAGASRGGNAMAGAGTPAGSREGLERSSGGMPL